MAENKKPDSGQSPIHSPTKDLDEGSDRNILQPLAERTRGQMYTTPTGQAAGSIEDVEANVLQFDSTRIPPDLYYSPDLESLDARHPLNNAWHGDMHRQFHLQIGVLAEGAICGCPAALPSTREDRGEIHPLFVVYLERIDILNGLVDTIKPLVKALLSRFHPENPKLIIRYYEWEYQVLGIQLITKPPPKPQPSYQHSISSRMGHSVGARGSPNAGTVFGFVSLFDKETGIREPGEFAVVPSHVATSLDHKMELKEGDRMLKPLQSPAFPDHKRDLEKLGNEVYEINMLLAKNMLKETAKRSAEDENQLIEEMETFEAEYVKKDAFDTRFGTVLYSTGICYRPADDGRPDLNIMDCALVKLEENRTGLNRLAREEGAEWPTDEAWKELLPALKNGQLDVTPQEDLRTEVLDKLPTIKLGRTTRVTQGELQPTRLHVNFEKTEYWGYGVWARGDACVQWPGPHSSPGDSGAPVVSNTGKVLGMIVAGNPKRIKEGFVTGFGGRSFDQRDVSIFIRWKDIKQELESKTKWRVEWYDGNSTPSLKLPTDSIPKPRPTSPKSRPTSPQKSAPGSPSKSRRPSTTQKTFASETAASINRRKGNDEGKL